MKHIIIVIFFLLFEIGLFGQFNFGIPDIKNFTRQNYQAGSQNWGIVQDRNGIMFFGNNDGLLSFDGYRWRLYPLPDKKNVRSLAASGDSIFVGGQGDIGYFSPNIKGELVYHSLKSKIPVAFRSDFADVWNVIVADDKIFFRSNRHIFTYKEGIITAFRSLNWSFLGKIDNQIFAYDDAKGLMQFQNDNWQLLLPKQYFPSNVQISNILRFNNEVWIITLTNGVFKLEGNTIQPFKTATIDHLQHGYIYGAIPIDQRKIALLTNLDGCEILDTNGNFLSKISRKEGLQNNNIISGFLDKDQNLWLGLGNGIDMIAINKPIYNIYPDGEDPIAGYVSALYKGYLFLGTATGVYQTRYQAGIGFSNDFHLVENTNGQIWNLSSIDNYLMIGQYRNAFAYNDLGLKKINKNPTGFWNFQKIPGTNIIVAGTYNGVHFFQSTPSGIYDLNIEALFESAQYVVVDGYTIWAMHPYKGLYKVLLSKDYKPLKIEHIEKVPFLSTSHNHLFKVKNKVIITSEKGIYEWNNKTSSFERSSYFSSLFGNVNLDYIQATSRDGYWFAKNGTIGFAKPLPDGKYQLEYFSELKGRLQFNEGQHILLLNDSSAVVSAERGFIYIDASKYNVSLPYDKVAIRTFMIQTPTKDSILYGGFEVKDFAMPQLVYKFNSVSLTFGVPSYGYNHSIQYSYKLQGLDENWSSWSGRTEKSYTNLQPRVYHFMVRARYGDGRILVKEADFAFEILAPWYRTNFAYIIYILLLLFGIAIGLKYLYDRYDRKQAIKIKAYNEEFEKKQKELQWKHELEKEQNEKKLAQVNSEKLKMELDMQNATIAANAMVLIHKGELLNKLKKELSEIVEEKDAIKSSSLKKVIKAFDQEINKEEDWDQFALHFNKVHEDFLKKVKEHYPALSQGDLKLCALLRLGMASKDIAGILNISLKSVEISRYRLRKKMKLNTEENLTEVLSNIG